MVNDIQVSGEFSTSIVEIEVENLDYRERIETLQKEVESLPQVMPELKHFFAHGIYARQGIIKKGTVLIGAIKKYSHINIITSGDISIFTESGEMRITGATTIVSQGGTKRVGYAHEDTVWTTIISTSETEVEKAEQEVLCKTYEEYVEYCNNIKLLEA